MLIHEYGLEAKVHKPINFANISTLRTLVLGLKEKLTLFTHNVEYGKGRSSTKHINGSTKVRSDSQNRVYPSFLVKERIDLVVCQS